MGRYSGKTCRLLSMVTLTSSFFLVEIIVGYITNSIALVADSFHMLSDVVSLIVAFAAVRISKWNTSKNTFGWARAEVLGALVNAVFLLALCFSILVESLKRLVQPEKIEDPKLLLIVGVVGLLVNVLGLFLFGHHGHSHGGGSHSHESEGEALVAGDSHQVDPDQAVVEIEDGHGHGHSHGKKGGEAASGSQLNMRAAFLHILGDALGSVVVIVSAVVIWFGEGDWKYYIDPGMSIVMVIIILCTTVPLLKESSYILLQAVPNHIEVQELEVKLQKIEGVLAVHEFHIWALAGNRIIASAHVRCQNLHEYMILADKIKEMFHHEGIHSTTIQPEFVEIDQKILSWVLRQRDLQLPISHATLTAYAKRIIVQETPGFRGFSGWLRQFLRRNNLSSGMKTSLSQKLPSDLEVRLATFRQRLRKTRAEFEFDMRMIINMDEVPMYFDLIPRKTKDVKGKKDVRILTPGGEKRHFTVVLAVSATGEKLPPMIIFKGEQPLNLTVPKGCLIRVNSNGLMTETLMLDWLQHIMKPYTESRPALLVMDGFSAHLAASVEAACRQLHATTAVIPGGCTSHAQPLDVGVNKPFKDRLRSLWAESICRKVKKTNCCPKTSKQEVVDWVTMAWASLPADLVAKSFRVTGISSALDGSEDDRVDNEKLIAEFFADDDDEDEECLCCLDEDICVDTEDPFLDYSDSDMD